MKHSKLYKNILRLPSDRAFGKRIYSVHGMNQATKPLNLARRAVAFAKAGGR
jgi:hypothetical protein